MIRVGVIMCASHVDAQHRMHGHTYEVWAEFLSGACALARQADLQFIVSKYDHTILPVEVERAEDLAEAIGRAFQDSACLAVEVNRPPERICTRWEA